MIVPNKKEILAVCIHKLMEQIESCTQAIQSAQEASNSEDKSSAGDKYETARAMGHLNKQMHEKQLMLLNKELQQLKNVQINTPKNIIQLGTLIYNKKDWIYIANSTGRIVVEDIEVTVISPFAPLAQVLLNKKPGDTYTWNKIAYTIQSIY